jgi:hypothetical protein
MFYSSLSAVLKLASEYPTPAGWVGPAGSNGPVTERRLGTPTPSTTPPDGLEAISNSQGWLAQRAAERNLYQSRRLSLGTRCCRQALAPQELRRDPASFGA